MFLSADSPAAACQPERSFAISVMTKCTGDFWLLHGGATRYHVRKHCFGSAVAKILIVEDNETLAESVSDWLVHEGHTVDMVHEGRAGLDYLSTGGYDVVILDWQLPQLSGVEVLRQYREQGGKTAVVMLTALDSIGDKLQGLESGADDYVTKPFDVQELAARVKALLRRPKGYVGEVLSAAHVTMNTSTHQVTCDGKEVHLKRNEYQLLEFFMRHLNQIFTVEVLLERVWSAEVEASLDAVYTCINRLRRKLDLPGQDSIIKTVHGVGYQIIQK